MLLEHSQYQAFLKAELSDRQDKNPSYSLRAYARDIGVPASHLSMVLNGKGHLSGDRAADVAARLGLTGTEAEYFRLLVEYDVAKSPDTRANLATRLRQIAGERAIKDLTVDAFKMIADWYHLPLLMMTSIPGESFQPVALSKRLGISKIDAEVALNRLERLEFIKKQPDGSYSRWENTFRVASPTPNSALRRYHRQIFEKASQSLETQKPEERFVGSETVAISPSMVPMINEEIEKMVSAILGRINAAAEETAPTEIYNLNLSFFRITNPKDESQTHEAKAQPGSNQQT